MDGEEGGEVASWHTRREEGFLRFPGRVEVEDGLGEVERLCEGRASRVRWAVGVGLDF